MKAIIINNDDNLNGYQRGDIISWGSPSTKEMAEKLSQELIDPEDPESNLMYGKCELVEGDREKIRVDKELVDVDYPQAYTWNFDTKMFDLKNDVNSKNLIIMNAKFYAISRIENSENKSKKIEKPIDKKEYKDNVENISGSNLKKVLNDISSVVAAAIVNEPSDKEVHAFIKAKREKELKEKKKEKSRKIKGRITNVYK